MHSVNYLKTTIAAVLAGCVVSLVASCYSTQQSTETLSGVVTRVHDGDSIHITPPGRKRVIVRLAGIDAPELKQAFGVASRDALRAMILQRSAQAHCHKTDRYRRQVCVVMFEGRDINLQMVSGGHAWHYKHYEDEQSRQQRRDYARAEREARNQRRGLWGLDRHMAPWDFRRAAQ